MEMEMGVGGCMSLELQYDQKKAFFFFNYILMQNPSPAMAQKLVIGCLWP